MLLLLHQPGVRIRPYLTIKEIFLSTFGVPSWVYSVQDISRPYTGFLESKVKNVASLQKAVMLLPQGAI